jgi:microcystin-dependent protein
MPVGISPVEPVGTIIAYAGDPSAANPSLEDQGWMVCDGRTLYSGVDKSLFDAIGNNFGGNPSAGTFNIPNLVGQFLRGLSPAPTTRDPDGASRTALAVGGNTGNKVGSLQGYGTASPQNAFTVSYRTAYYTNCHAGAGVDCAKTGSGSNTASVTGGDKETRPENKYVYFLIKYLEFTASHDYVELPIGAVVPFAGVGPTLIKTNFILCNGSPYDQTQPQYQALFAALGNAHGTATNGNAILPDYRGYFLRGVDASGTVDKNASTRSAPYPANPQSPGNSGAKIGSEQGYSTAIPSSGNLKASINKVVDGVNGKRNELQSWTVSKWNAGNTTIKLNGGDLESRPVNMAVDWYVRFQ